MGTLFRIKLYAETEQQARQAFHAAFARIGQLDAILSDYAPDSELNRLCRAGSAKVSGDLFRVLEASQQLAEASGGAFDVTIGPLTHLWREARKSHQLPSEQQIHAAVARCGFRKLHLEGGMATLTLPGMQLDVGGIAKGDAADQALAVLKQAGITRALVAASGDLAFSDPPPGQLGWKIGIDLSDKPHSGFTDVRELANAAVSSSGNTEQHLDADGKRYSHIIDPATGYGLTRDIRVTVIAPRGIIADGLATAISVLGQEPGLKLLQSYPGSSAIVTVH